MRIRAGNGLLLLLACIPLVSPALAGEVYKQNPGPYEVRTLNSVILTDAEQERDVTLRVIFPEGEGPFPMVAYSTGMFCVPQLYDRILSHWASHGYVVIQPNHLDSPNNEEKLKPAQYDILLASRARDMSFILDSLDEITAAAEIEGRVDGSRAAIGGHSFGAVISMIKTGLYVKDYYKGPWGDPYDDRFDVAVLMSGVGYGMKEIEDNAFEGLRKPLFASGGSEDVGRVSPGGMTGTQWRMQPFLLAPIPGDNYSVITQGTDHYMGGLICNDKLGGEPDYEAVRVVRAMTTAFLDAYIKDDPAAMDYLRTADLAEITDGYANLQQR